MISRYHYFAELLDKNQKTKDLHQHFITSPKGIKSQRINLVYQPYTSFDKSYGQFINLD